MRNAHAQLLTSLRRLAQRRRRVTKLATWEHLLLGGMSGAVAAAATCPLDALKTAQQVVVAGTAPTVGMLGTLGTTVRTGGPGALFVGMVRGVGCLCCQWDCIAHYAVSLT